MIYLSVDTITVDKKNLGDLLKSNLETRIER